MSGIDYVEFALSDVHYTLPLLRVLSIVIRQVNVKKKRNQSRTNFLKFALTVQGFCEILKNDSYGSSQVWRLQLVGIECVKVPLNIGK